jgi:phage terminase large subunit-like protein
VLFELAAKMVRMSLDLDIVCGIRDTIKQIHCPELGTVYQALSAEAKTKHGKSPIFLVHDELGQVKGPRSALYEALETATSANMNPLSIVISTQAPSDADLLSVLIDDALTGADPRTIVEIYTASLDMDPFSEDAIRAANPAYGDFQNPAEIKLMAADAKRMPAREAEYRNLILNQRVEVRQPFISRQVWIENGATPVPNFDGLPVYAGLDLAEVSDLAAFVPMAPIDGGKFWDVIPTFWMPGDGIREKSRTDRVPYDVWADEGWIEAVPGPVIDFAFISEFLRGFCLANDVRMIAYDDWGWNHLRPLLSRAGFRDDQLDGDRAIFQPMRQGFKTISPALQALEALLLTRKIRHGNHPVLEMCARNAVVAFNETMSRKLVKNKSHGRIDGMVALAMAAAVAGTWEQVKRVDIRTMIV